MSAQVVGANTEEEAAEAEGVTLVAEVEVEATSEVAGEATSVAEAEGVVILAEGEAAGVVAEVLWLCQPSSQQLWTVEAPRLAL